jgi:hypothetical protein
MQDNRERGLLAIFERVKIAKNSGALAVAAFKRSPTVPIAEAHLPCIFMIEGVDDIVKPSTRNPLGYPAYRDLEVTLEIISNAATDVKELYRNVRVAVFKDGAVVTNNTFIRETRTEGPTGYGLPDVLGMRLVLILSYMDEGI